MVHSQSQSQLATTSAPIDEVLESVVKEPKPPLMHVTSPKHPHSLHPTTSSSSSAHHKPSSTSLSPLNFSSGTRSPSGSIPSSPTSIHSSSSAIFERDIEQPLSATALASTTLTKDPHHTARARAHEPLENAVPSVLDAAVSVLGELESKSAAGSPTRDTSSGAAGAAAKKGMSMDEISVIAPSPLSPANWTTSSNASIRTHGGGGVSRSPSPSPNIIPLPGSSFTTSPTPSRIVRSAVPQRLNTGGSTAIDQAQGTPTPHASETPSLSVIGIVPPTPNANSFGFTSRTAGSSPSPQSATASPLIITPPLPGSMPIPRPGAGGAGSRSTSRPTSIAMSLEELSLAPLVTTTADSDVPVPSDVEPIGRLGRRPPSPDNAKNRLSFISYNDLLNSTPVSAFSLGTAVTATTEPPHQIDVTVRTRSRTTSRQSTVNRSPVSDVFGVGSASPPSILGVTSTDEGSPSPPPLPVVHAPDSGLKGGGEWQREGFGTGLEERLEAALKDQPTSTAASPTTETRNL